MVHSIDPVRQIAIRDLGHDQPTLLLTDQREASAAERIENTIADAVNFFHVDALSAAVPLRIDLDVQLTLMASAPYRLLANRLGQRFRNAEPASLFRKFVQANATVDILPPVKVIVGASRCSYALGVGRTQTGHKLAGQPQDRPAASDKSTARLDEPQ